MTCHEHQADLVDVARGVGPLDLPGEGLRTHLDGCADCAARFERERQLSAGLRALARQAEVVDANPFAERRLVEMFESGTDARPGRRAYPSGRRASGMWALAAAAGLVLCVGAAWTAWTVVQRHSVPRGGEGQVSVVGAPAAATSEASRAAGGTRAPRSVDVPPPDAAAPTGLPGLQANADGVRPVATTSRRTASHGRRSPVVEDGGAFMALPAADRLPGFESGMIVRVELPVSSLPAYGLEIVPDAARTPVRADVLVGQDGQPRAIRLVSMGSGPRRIR